MDLPDFLQIIFHQKGLLLGEIIFFSIFASETERWVSGLNRQSRKLLYPVWVPRVRIPLSPLS